MMCSPSSLRDRDRVYIRVAGYLYIRVILWKIGISCPWAIKSTLFKPHWQMRYQNVRNKMPDTVQEPGMGTRRIKARDRDETETLTSRDGDETLNFRVETETRRLSLSKRDRDVKVKVFTALHVMQTRYSDENSVCLSVCHTRALWKNGRKIGPHFYIIRKII